MHRLAARIVIALVTLPFGSLGAGAQLAVSANDGKSVLVDGAASVPANPVADYVTIIDLNVSPPKIVAEVAAPASVVGPPQSVAIANDESFALVTGAMKIDPADPKKVVPDDALTVIDLKSSPPKATATLQAGKGAAGVSINRAGTLALVANRSEGTVSVFTIADKTLTPAGKVEFGEKSGPSDVAFLPDGKTALVTRDGDSRIAVLSIEGNKVEYTKRDMAAGLRPYSLDISAKGDIAVVGNVGVGLGDNDTISLIDLKTPYRIVDTVTVGPSPESVSLSPDGAFVAVTVLNGSNRPKSTPQFNDYGLLKIFSVNGAKLVPVTEAKVGHWCQGSAWAKDGRTLLHQCMVENEIMVFSFDGNALTPKDPIKLRAGPAGLRAAGR